jgi:hypothetical protein
MPEVKEDEATSPEAERGQQALDSGTSAKKPKSSIITEQNGGDSAKQDDCSDLTDNNADTDESSCKGFPQKVSISFVHLRSL